MSKLYYWQMILNIFPILFTTVTFLTHLIRGYRVESMFFFFGLLLTILLGIIIIYKNKKANQNIISCNIFLPPDLKGPLSLNSTFYSYVMTYMFAFEGTLNYHPYLFVFLLIFSIGDAFLQYGKKCTTMGEWFAGVFLGGLSAFVMILVKKRYFPSSEFFLGPKKDKKCRYIKNKYICEESVTSRDIHEEKKTEKNPSGIALYIFFILFTFFTIFSIIFAGDRSAELSKKYIISIAVMVIACFVGPILFSQDIF